MVEFILGITVMAGFIFGGYYLGKVFLFFSGGISTYNEDLDMGDTFLTGLLGVCLLGLISLMLFGAYHLGEYLISNMTAI